MLRAPIIQLVSRFDLTHGGLIGLSPLSHHLHMPFKYNFEENEMIAVLRHRFYTVSLCWAGEIRADKMNFVMNQCPGAGSIA